MTNFKKSVMAIFMIMILAVAMFSATAVVTNAEGEYDLADQGAEYTEYAEEGAAETFNDETVATEAETEPETELSTDATEATEATVATEAPTTAPTVAPTTAPTVAPTTPAKNGSPKTGDFPWLWVGIGVAAVAVIAIIGTVIAKKKSAK